MRPSQMPVRDWDRWAMKRTRVRLVPESPREKERYGTIIQSHDGEGVLFQADGYEPRLVPIGYIKTIEEAT